MKKILLGTVAAIILGAPASFAADMPVKARSAPVPVPAIYNWTGFYVGINGGAGRGHTDWEYVGFRPTADHNTSGGLLGGTLGFNYQVQNWVFGIEGDWDWARINDSTACPNSAYSCKSKIKSLGTIRGRVGPVWGNALLYVTGGWARADMTIQTVHPKVGTNGSNATPNGWTLGGGIEYGLTPNWSVKAEYLHVAPGTNRYTVDAALQVDARERVNILRAGLNYRFSSF